MLSFETDRKIENIYIINNPAHMQTQNIKRNANAWRELSSWTCKTWIKQTRIFYRNITYLPKQVKIYAPEYIEEISKIKTCAYRNANLNNTFHLMRRNINPSKGMPILIKKAQLMNLQNTINQFHQQPWNIIYGAHFYVMLKLRNLHSQKCKIEQEMSVHERKRKLWKINANSWTYKKTKCKFSNLEPHYQTLT